VFGPWTYFYITILAKSQHSFLSSTTYHYNEFGFCPFLLHDPILLLTIPFELVINRLIISLAADDINRPFGVVDEKVLILEAPYLVYS
jgi:hypothetical protein